MDRSDRQSKWRREQSLQRFSNVPYQFLKESDSPRLQALRQSGWLVEEDWEMPQLPLARQRHLPPPAM